MRKKEREKERERERERDLDVFVIGSSHQKKTLLLQEPQESKIVSRRTFQKPLKH